MNINNVLLFHIISGYRFLHCLKIPYSIQLMTTKDSL